MKVNDDLARLTSPMHAHGNNVKTPAFPALIDVVPYLAGALNVFCNWGPSSSVVAFIPAHPFTAQESSVTP